MPSVLPAAARRASRSAAACSAASDVRVLRLGGAAGFASAAFLPAAVVLDDAALPPLRLLTSPNAARLRLAAVEGLPTVDDVVAGSLDALAAAAAAVARLVAMARPAAPASLPTAPAGLDEPAGAVNPFAVDAARRWAFSSRTDGPPPARVPRVVRRVVCSAATAGIDHGGGRREASRKSTDREQETRRSRKNGGSGRRVVVSGLAEEGEAGSRWEIWRRTARCKRRWARRARPAREGRQNARGCRSPSSRLKRSVKRGGRRRCWVELGRDDASTWGRGGSDGGLLKRAGC